MTSRLVLLVENGQNLKARTLAYGDLMYLTQFKKNDPRKI